VRLPALGKIVANCKSSVSFNPWGTTFPQGRGVPIFIEENTMSQIVDAMSDADLLGVIVGVKPAARMLKDAGSISALLNQSIGPYDPQPKVKTRLLAAKELVRRSLLERL